MKNKVPKFDVTEHNYQSKEPSLWAFAGVFALALAFGTLFYLSNAWLIAKIISHFGWLK